MQLLKYFISIVIGVMLIVASWYSVLVFVVLTLSYIVAQSAVIFKKAWNGE